jgi:LemA protein
MTQVVVLLIVLLGLVALIPIVSYNRFVGQRQEIASAWGTIDAELERRHHLVPQLVESVRAAAAHEREVLTRLIEADRRSQASRVDPAAAGAAEAEVRYAMGSVMALREAYPQLNSSQNFLRLQDQLSLIEDRIAAARRFYNTRVVAYNERVDAFPSNLVAANRGFVKAAYFGSDG